MDHTYRIMNTVTCIHLAYMYCIYNDVTCTCTHVYVLHVYIVTCTFIVHTHCYIYYQE